MKWLCLVSMLCIAAIHNAQDMKKDPRYQQAVKLAHSTIITDGHVDLPYRLQVRNFRLEKEFLGIPIET
ncbi:MAG: membrane dipeptidase, partial [Saprospiraceae bacterium]|nr:membrane dipeptidase [Saprospiraceae bacterium]